MKRGILALLIFLILILASIADKRVESSIEDEIERNEEANVIVVLKHPNIMAEFKNPQDRALNKINYVYYRDRFQGNYDFRIKHKYKTINAFSGNVTKSGLVKLMNDPDVEAIMLAKNYKVDMSEASALINVSAINSVLLSNANITGSGKSICIIDTGINYSHESFGSCTNASFLAGNCIKVLNGTNTYADSSNILDDHGHGTHVAGIASANGSVKGVAPDSSLIIIKACDSGGNCNEADILDGIDYCTLYREQYNISIISMSLGDGISYTDGTCPSTWNTYLNAAYSKNISIVAASGNEAYTSGISHPGCAPNITSIGAVYDADLGSKSWIPCTDSTTNADKIACFTNRFSNLDLLAPGSVITSTSKSGSTESRSGTSMATPFAAGAIALLQQYSSNEYGYEQNQSRIYSALNSSGKPTLDSSTGLTFSRIDPYSASILLDTKKPGISESIKQPSQVNTTNNVVFYANATDSFIDSIIIEIGINNNLANYTVDKSVGNTYNFTLAYPNFSANQNVSWRFYAIDMNRNMNSTSTQSFLVNGETPSVSISYPYNNSFLSSALVDFLFVANDDNPNLSCSLYIDGILNKTNSSVLNNTQTNFTIILAEKSYESYVNCTDSQFNSNASTIVEFTVDLTNPLVYLSYPMNNGLVNTNYFNFSSVDTNLANCTLYGNWSGWHANKTITPANNTISNISIQNLADGNYIWNVKCTDNSSRYGFNSTNYTIEIDAAGPAITIDGPYNKTYSYNTSISLNLSVNEINSLDKKWYSIDNGSNITITDNATINVSSSPHMVNVYANDSLGNLGHASVSFSIDMSYPGISLISPANDSVKTDSGSVTFSYNATDNVGLANCSLIIDSSIDQEDSSITINIEQTFSRTLSNGEYNWNVNCTDNANLANTSAVNVITVNVSSGGSDDDSPGSSSSSSSGGGGGSSSSPASEDENVDDAVLLPDIELPNIVEEKDEELTVTENTDVNATSSGKESSKLPLTGRAISIIKGAVKPKGILLGIIAASVMVYIAFRIRKKKNVCA